MTASGTWVPPGPSKKIWGPSPATALSAGKWRRRASTSRFGMAAILAAAAPCRRRGALPGQGRPGTMPPEMDATLAPRATARDAQLAPWRAFLRAHARVARRLDEDLRSRHGLSLQEYETLLHL